jgi:hypothetical protein
MAETKGGKTPPSTPKPAEKPPLVNAPSKNPHKKSGKRRGNARSQ